MVELGKNKLYLFIIFMFLFVCEVLVIRIRGLLCAGAVLDLVLHVGEIAEYAEMERLIRCLMLQCACCI